MNHTFIDSTNSSSESDSERRLKSSTILITTFLASTTSNLEAPGLAVLLLEAGDDLLEAAGLQPRLRRALLGEAVADGGSRLARPRRLPGVRVRAARVRVCLLVVKIAAIGIGQHHPCQARTVGKTHLNRDLELGGETLCRSLILALFLFL